MDSQIEINVSAGSGYWRAWVVIEDTSPVGTGDTRQEAIDNLRLRLDEMDLDIEQARCACTRAEQRT